MARRRGTIFDVYKRVEMKGVILAGGRGTRLKSDNFANQQATSADL